MGTWKLVEKPPNVIPIANKWVFAKKRDKMGQIIKYKARLVAKGCAQRPGHDYVETHSPVVRLETLRAILSILPKEKLIVQQMNVKGAYLNGTLKEHQQKSTFLIPSYSILLHLIPLILGVRRE